ncbi:oxysterol-binding protein-related protein 5-like isoform X3 [Corvus kubaryi]|uniref:oxysterol-binding protein-related protein 5-like isoform X3 n=1 Tax=Corvus kubaryi TaxID=68294 RepID=UPI001C03E951|nr:oxysterol-binding protein-related protein 5-like isoform X3 [Corvus kubaryi]
MPDSSDCHLCEALLHTGIFCCCCSTGRVKSRAPLNGNEVQDKHVGLRTGWLPAATAAGPALEDKIGKTPTAHAMKEENFLRRRFSLCPASSTPQKVDPRKLTRNLFFGADNDIYPLSPGKDVEGNSPSSLKDETPQTPNSIGKIEYKLCNGSDKECVSPTAKFMKKETLKVQKKNYRQEKKRATKQLFSALKDPSVVITADWLKIRGTLKSWTKLWCVLKPGVLLIYKTPKIGQWVGTILLHSCELIERPSKKDGFCFKLFHPLDQSIWAVKGPKGENVGSITQPLPSSYLIFRAASESDGKFWGLFAFFR